MYAKYLYKDGFIDKSDLKKMIAGREIKISEIALASIDENKQLTITTY